MTSSGASAVVPPCFHYEAKYILLNFMRKLPVHRSRTLTTELGDAQDEWERSRRMKQQIDDELKLLQQEVNDSFSESEFDLRHSVVFCPPNPDNSVEECLAAMGHSVSRDLGPHLTAAVEKLLSGPLDYQRFQSTALDLARHTEPGWNKVLVPLLLLQALRFKGKPLSALLQLGLRCLQEVEAQFIIQQGGWGKVLSLVQNEDEDLAAAVADDSNDICILSEEQQPDALISGEPSAWQTDSLPASLGGHDCVGAGRPDGPEDVKDLHGGEGVALVEERSENNSSNSDIVHVEREEAELMEECEEAGDGDGIEESMMSLLMTESDLAALHGEYGDPVLHAQPSPSLVLPEEPVVMETPKSLVPEPEAPPPVPAVEPDPDPEPKATTQAEEVPPEPAEPETPPEPASIPKQNTEPDLEPEPESDFSVTPEPEDLAEEAPVLEVPIEALAKPEPEPEEESPILLYGGAVLVLVAAVSFSLVLFRRRR